MGEVKRKALAARKGVGQEPSEPQVVDTLGRRMHVRGNEGAAATPHGQLVFFAEFLAATGVFERWVAEGPLAGHRRYAHITALRGDAVAAQALGMNKVVSEDALRRVLERIDETRSAAGLRPSLMHSVREVLGRPWALDIDASVKPLYGRQEGAEISYNPAKRKRPSHVLHTFLVANLRLVLDVQVSSGKRHTSGHAKAALGRLLDELGDRRPALLRGASTASSCSSTATGPTQRTHSTNGRSSGGWAASPRRTGTAASPLGLVVNHKHGWQRSLLGVDEGHGYAGDRNL